MKTCLITGGAGFIGSHLADELLSRNCRVVVLDNLSLGRKSNLTSAMTNPNFKFVEGDILDEDTLNGVFAQNRFDMVFHLAANSDIARSHANPEIDLNMTFLTTFRVLEAMRRHNVKRLMSRPPPPSTDKPAAQKSAKTTARFSRFALRRLQAGQRRRHCQLCRKLWHSGFHYPFSKCLRRTHHTRHFA